MGYSMEKEHIPFETMQKSEMQIAKKKIIVEFRKLVIKKDFNRITVY